MLLCYFVTGALEDLLDYVFCAGPFDAPADPTEEQQAADLASEQSALSVLRSGFGPKQQQGLGSSSSSAQGLAQGAGGLPLPAAAAVEEAAAAAAEPAAAAAADGDSSAWHRLLPDPSLEDMALRLQHWLLQRYSSSSSSSLKRLVTCVSTGSDLSVLAPLLPGLKSLGLSVPPCLEGFKASENGGPVDVKTLPELQLWMGDGGLGFGAKLAAAKPSDAAESDSAAAAADGGNEDQQQQQQQWLKQVGQHTVSFAGSFLAGPAAKPQARCFADLGVLSVSNLTRADGPWEPSALLGDKLLAAVAFGCPALKTLEVRKT
jgi:hypothetical protein